MRFPLPIWGILALLTVGCGDSSMENSGWDYYAASDTTSPMDTKSDTNYGDSSGTAGDTTLPPEQEKETDFGAPQGSPNYVYIPATAEDRIVRVSGNSLSVRLIDVGDQPTVLAIIPNQDAAVVIDYGSNEVAVIRSTEAQDTVAYVPVLPYCNALAMDPTGKFAVVFYDHARAQTGDPVGNFQSVTVVDLTAGKELGLRVSVGFRPRSVAFTADGTRALVVTDDGISVLELAKLTDGQIVAPIPISKNPLDKPASREVLTTNNGNWAIVRSSGKAGLTAVHLPTKTIVEIPLTSEPTDLDLLPDGSAALAMLRESKEVAFVTLPKDVTDTLPAMIASTGELVAGLARITDDGKTAVLYTSVEGIEEIAILDIAEGTVLPILLRKTVDDVLLVPGARKAILVHKPGDGPGNPDETDQFVDDSQGYSLLDLDSGYTALVLTPVKPLEIGLSTEPHKAWFLLKDPKGLSHVVQEADLTSFQYTDHELGSAPEHVRFLSKAMQMAITQTHPSGRITFVHTQTGLAKTVTGFELNGQLP
jgi:DNA-binding beta-propeller fold protein YncE